MEIFSEIWDWICDTLFDLLEAIIKLLPDSPFYLLSVSGSPVNKYLNYINYFIDLQFIVDVGTAWLLAIAGYYTYSVVLRLVKAID
ncbi:MAG: hypothetical protein IJV39_01065 [Ruminococcus sp.]|nr:hypothetical protein [Ruminococcus sp.]